MDKYSNDKWSKMVRCTKWISGICDYCNKSRYYTYFCKMFYTRIYAYILTCTHSVYTRIYGLAAVLMCSYKYIMRYTESYLYVCWYTQYIPVYTTEYSCCLCQVVSFLRDFRQTKGNIVYQSTGPLQVSIYDSISQCSFMSGVHGGFYVSKKQCYSRSADKRKQVYLMDIRQVVSFLRDLRGTELLWDMLPYIR